MKKHFLTICIFSALAFGSISCDSNDDNHVHPENKLEKFKGTWVGTYSGDGEGTWTATFDSSGNAEGTLVSGSNTFKLTGEVAENGTINAEFMSGTNVVGTMTGTLTEKTGSGTWNNKIQNYNGTWQGTKN
ncbi:hypothetical protein [Paenimyroides viscosum]|uniref:Uncharacterized protein n=1 Tax=Paenimyroides viscosum TaxID=2488729 RepID=A0A3P1B233_9FLAO|nr:hypothetical protein [Paenimyroides viscosum]RRA95104.1 hypothetical protein EG242_06785 [Paenimyroides viscosum]